MLFFVFRLLAFRGLLGGALRDAPLFAVFLVIVLPVFLMYRIIMYKKNCYSIRATQHTMTSIFSKVHPRWWSAV